MNGEDSDFDEESDDEQQFFDHDNEDRQSSLRYNQVTFQQSPIYLKEKSSIW
jgi:hypothetical protein